MLTRNDLFPNFPSLEIEGEGVFNYADQTSEAMAWYYLMHNMDSVNVDSLGSTRTAPRFAWMFGGSEGSTSLRIEGYSEMISPSDVGFTALTQPSPKYLVGDSITHLRRIPNIRVAQGFFVDVGRSCESQSSANSCVMPSVHNEIVIRCHDESDITLAISGFQDHQGNFFTFLHDEPKSYIPEFPYTSFQARDVETGEIMVDLLIQVKYPSQFRTSSE